MVHHVILAGGPAAGKTSVLELLKALPRHETAPKIILLNEVATFLFSLFPDLRKNTSQDMFQAVIYASQVLTQYIIDQAFESNEGDVLCISDRGCLDLNAYTTNTFCALTGFAPDTMPQYDLVLYLESPDCFVERQNNPYRQEDADSARVIEAKTRHAWERSDKFCIIPVCSTIAEKALCVAEAINQQFGPVFT